MFDDLSLFPRYNRLVAQLGVPFYNVPGNHDMNYGAADDRYALLTLQAEVRAEDRLGIPDFAASREGLLLGFIELKAPGLGADTARLTGRNRQQWDRFKRLLNLIYTDGNEWALYQNGERTGWFVRFQGDITRQGRAAVSADDAREDHRRGHSANTPGRSPV